MNSGFANKKGFKKDKREFCTAVQLANKPSVKYHS